MITPQSGFLKDDAPLQVHHSTEGVARILAGYQNKMAQCILEIARGGGLERLSEQGTLPSRVLRLFHKALGLFDESTQYFLGRLRRSGFTVRCGRECVHCCTNMPAGVSTIELISLYHGAHQGGTFSRFFRRCLEAEQTWAEACRQARIDHCGRRDSETTREAALQSYLHAERPCPFLQSGSCQVYPYRPFACRMHFSLSPPEWCRPSHFQHAHAVRFNVEPGTCVLDALDRLDTAFQLNLSDVMACGLLELTVNVMKFEEIRWL